MYVPAHLYRYTLDTGTVSVTVTAFSATDAMFTGAELLDVPVTSLTFQLLGPAVPIRK